jgi:hypothetical protein
MRYLPPVSLAFFGGVALLALGQVVPSYDAGAFLDLLGGALLIVVAIRALAGWAGLHREPGPLLESGETLLAESEGVMIETPTLWISSRRGPYRVRLTNLRLLVSLRVLRVTTQRDVTAAWLIPGRSLSLRSIHLRPGGEIVLEPERRFGPRLRFWVRNAREWLEALNQSHPELLRYEGEDASTST